MNYANAFGFFGLGVAMWLLPLVVPGWFPHTAVDGTSTRALWTQVMGLVQFGLGLGFLIRHAAGPIAQWAGALWRGAVATADWQTDAVPTGAVAIDVALVPALAESPMMAAEAGSITLHGEHAALWRTLHTALASEHRVAQLSARLRALLRERGIGPHPIATAMFRHHPQTSFVHLTGPHLGAFETVGSQTQEQLIGLLRDAAGSEQRQQRLA